MSDKKFLLNSMRNKKVSEYRIKNGISTANSIHDPFLQILPNGAGKSGFAGKPDRK